MMPTPCASGLVTPPHTTAAIETRRAATGKMLASMMRIATRDTSRRLAMTYIATTKPVPAKRSAARNSKGASWTCHATMSVMKNAAHATMPMRRKRRRFVRRSSISKSSTIAPRG